MSVPKIWRKIPQYYNLVGKSCSCGLKYFPPRDICPSCGAHPLEDYAFKGEGEIVTFTVLRTTVADPEGEIVDVHFSRVPYVLAIIRLDEGPSLTAEIVDCDISEVEIGKRVEVVFRKIKARGNHGVIQYGYKFAIVR